MYKCGISLALVFNEKAKKWVDGRKGIFARLNNSIRKEDKIIWVHCASLGEFEQGRPVIEALKKEYSQHKILLTFFSPSGYEARKNYATADCVCYLPQDGGANAKKFLEIVNPKLAIFVKYEYWYFYLKNLKARKIPTLFISSIFTKDKPFFKWYGGLHRKMLEMIDHIFVQNQSSKDILGSIGINHCSVSGDTRFDRVVEIAANKTHLALIENFTKNSTVIVAGSTWEPDEILLNELLRKNIFSNLKLIIAPHEIGNNHLTQLKTLFPESVFYTQIDGTRPFQSNVLIIDKIGLLSQLYKYATVAYIGGGFGKGIHNTLEAAVYGKLILLGPNYTAFAEATSLVNIKSGHSIKNTETAVAVLKSYFENPEQLLEASRKAAKFVAENTGATKKIMEYIYENRLLIS